MAILSDYSLFRIILKTYWTLYHSVKKTSKNKFITLFLNGHQLIFFLIAIYKWAVTTTRMTCVYKKLPIPN